MATSEMAKTFSILLALLLITGVAAVLDPVSDSHRSSAVDLFSPRSDGSYASLEEAYQAVRVFKVLDIHGKNDQQLCRLALDAIKSSSVDIKEVCYSIKISETLSCGDIDADAAKSAVDRLLSHVSVAKDLLDYYYPLVGLVSIKKQGWLTENVIGSDTTKNIFQSIKALGQTDGTWRYSSSDGESSAYAAGLALESIAGALELGASEIKHAAIESVKKSISKLFDGLESYDDGSFYFEEKSVDVARGNEGPLMATSAVVRGVTTFAAAISEQLNIPEDKIVGIAKFLLSVGVPGSPLELYHQLDALGHLDNNEIVIPLILSFPATVLSLTSHDQLKVSLYTVLGSVPPQMAMKVAHASMMNSKDVVPISDNKLDFNPEKSVYSLSFPSEGVEVGKYLLTFEVFPEMDNTNKKYSTGGHTQEIITVTGIIEISDAEISVLDSDTGSAETIKRLDFSKDDNILLSANHLQKLHISFKLSSPMGTNFKPHQVFLILRHETKLEHTFLFQSSGEKFECVLDILGLVGKLYYLSGRYTVEMAVGDATMENSFLKLLGSLDLDLPEPPENAVPPRFPASDVLSRFSPKPEIEHIFRKPEKRPHAQLSNTFLVLTLLPLIGFLIGILILRVNLKNFPSSGLPAVSAILFNVGILAVLTLYALFWIKLNLFTTLKYLGFLGIFLLVVGHQLLSHLAHTTSKVKTN